MLISTISVPFRRPKNWQGLHQGLLTLTVQLKICPNTINILSMVPSVAAHRRVSIYKCWQKYPDRSMHARMQLKRKRSNKYWNSTCLVPQVCRIDSPLCDNRLIIRFYVGDKELKKNNAYCHQEFLKSSSNLVFSLPSQHSLLILLSQWVISCLLYPVTPLECPCHHSQDCVV